MRNTYDSIAKINNPIKNEKGTKNTFPPRQWQIYEVFNITNHQEDASENPQCYLRPTRIAIEKIRVNIG